MAEPRSRTLPRDLAVALLCAAAFFCLLLVSPDIAGGDDGYRHVKLASRLIRDPRAAFADPWRLVYFWPKPVDAWFGYHVLLAPFTLFLDLVVAAKALASAVLGGIVLVLLRLLRQVQVAYPAAWAMLALTGSSIVLHRAALSRPFLFSVLLALLATLYTLRGKPWAVAVVSAVHAVSYSMFFMVAFAPGVYALVKRDRQAWRILAASIGGIAAGLVLNPYFPENLRFDLLQTVSPFTVAAFQSISVSGEVAPLTVWWVAASLPIVVLWIVALAVALRRARTGELPAGAVLLGAMSLLAMLVSFRAARTFDYFVPLAVLFTAAMLSGWCVRKRRDALSLAVLAGIFCAVNVAVTYRQLHVEPSSAKFRGVSQYLATHGRGQVVVNSRWEQYPFLYFWNPDSRYLTGVDPTFLYFRDPSKYWLWRHISDDESATCARADCQSSERHDVAPALVHDLGAAFVVTEHDRNPRLESILRRSGSIKEVYRDQGCSLFAASST